MFVLEPMSSLKSLTSKSSSVELCFIKSKARAPWPSPFREHKFTGSGTVALPLRFHLITGSGTVALPLRVHQIAGSGTVALPLLISNIVSKHNSLATSLW